jgi:hypothetical protein
MQSERAHAALRVFNERIISVNIIPSQHRILKNVDRLLGLGAGNKWKRGAEKLMLALSLRMRKRGLAHQQASSEAKLQFSSFSK